MRLSWPTRDFKASSGDALKPTGPGDQSIASGVEHLAKFPRTECLGISGEPTKLELQSWVSVKLRFDKSSGKQSNSSPALSIWH